MWQPHWGRISKLLNRVAVCTLIYVDVNIVYVCVFRNDDLIAYEFMEFFFSLSNPLLFVFTWFMVYWLVAEVIEICFSPQILDCALGHNESALFRRAQLKALVSIHSKEVTLSYHSALEVFMFNQGYVTVRASTITGWQGWRAYPWWDYNHKWSLGPDRKGVQHLHYMWPIFLFWIKK